MFRRTGSRDMGAFVHHLGQLVESFDNRGMVSGAGDVQGLTKGFGFLGGKLSEGLADFGLHGFDLGPEFLVGHDLVTPIGADSVDCLGVLGRGIARDLGVEIYELLGTSLVEPKFAEDGGGTVDERRVEGLALGDSEFVFVWDDGGGRFSGGSCGIFDFTCRCPRVRRVRQWRGRLFRRRRSLRRRRRRCHRLFGH